MFHVSRIRQTYVRAKAATNRNQSKAEGATPEAYTAAHLYRLPHCREQTRSGAGGTNAGRDRGDRPYRQEVGPRRIRLSQPFVLGEGAQRKSSRNGTENHALS